MSPEFIREEQLNELPFALVRTNEYSSGYIAHGIVYYAQAKEDFKTMLGEPIMLDSNLNGTQVGGCLNVTRIIERNISQQVKTRKGQLVIYCPVAGEYMLVEIVKL